MKNTLAAVAVVFALTLPVWAKAPTKRVAAPEGGNWPTYTLVTGAALLGGLFLARKQRANETGR